MKVQYLSRTLTAAQRKQLHCQEAEVIWAHHSILFMLFDRERNSVFHYGPSFKH